MARWGTTTSYWLMFSCLLGSGVLIVGLVSFPLLFLLGGMLLGGYVITHRLHRLWHKEVITDAGLDTRFPVACGIITFNLGLLFRNSDWAPYLVPALAITASTTCWLWSRRYGEPLAPPAEAAE